MELSEAMAHPASSVQSSQNATRFKGQPIVLDGSTYIIPALALGAMRDLLPRIQKLRAIDGVPDADDLETMTDVIAAALQRNYPSITREYVLEVIDLGNLGDVFRTIMGASGLKKSEGNAVPGAATP